MANRLVHRDVTLHSDSSYPRIQYLDIIKIPHFFGKRYHSQSVFLITTVASTILLLTLTALLFSSAFAQQTPGTQKEDEPLETPGNISSNIDTKDTVLNKTGTDLPILSYDIAVYSDNGEQLWKKANQPVQAGRAYERITFENPYTGGITININNIKSAGNMGGTIGGPLSGPNENKSNDEKAQTDSINFTATVVEAQS